MTRMWLLPARWLCREHLLGEHSEMHQAAGTIANHPHGIAVMEGHRRDDAPDDVETALIVARHDRLAEEMGRRGMDHDWDNGLADFDDPGIGRLDGADIQANAGELARRCADCRARMLEESTTSHAYKMRLAGYMMDTRAGWPDNAWEFRDDG